MNLEAIKNLRFSYEGQDGLHFFPQLLIDSIDLINQFFKNSGSNKLCIIFPSRELAAQWISIPLSLKLLDEEFALHRQDISEAYKNYKPGQRLLLNNEALVEWVRGDEGTLTFRTKGKKRKKYWESTDGDLISISSGRINNLRPAPATRTALSSREFVFKHIRPSVAVPIDKLLGINSNGNLLFQKQSIALVSRYNSFENAVSQIQLNGTLIDEYFPDGKIDDNGQPNEQSPLVIANSLQSLAMYLMQDRKIARLVIDSYKVIHDRGLTDFSDIDREFRPPTILITDLSEIDLFDSIGNHGFSFFSFTKKQIQPVDPAAGSPFKLFDRKVKAFTEFRFQIRDCQDDELEVAFKLIRAVSDDQSDEVLTSLKIQLIQLLNSLSHVVGPLDSNTTDTLRDSLKRSSTLLWDNKAWLGDNTSRIREALDALQAVIERYSKEMPSKGIAMLEVISAESPDYIICNTESHANSISKVLDHTDLNKRPTVVSLSILDGITPIGPKRAVLVGWPKAINFNRLLSSFRFESLTFLFYKFERGYYNSVQKRNLKNLANIKENIDRAGNARNDNTDLPFEEIYNSYKVIEDHPSVDFDVLNFELRIDDAQFSKYYAKPGSDSIRARRIDFENDTFIYATETHKFIVINELLDKQVRDSKVYEKRSDGLKIGDVIALIKTDTDLLADLVQRITNKEEYQEVKKLTDLWKVLLREYFRTINKDFRSLVERLRKYECIKHEATIRNWLTDDNRIGPDDDIDLMSIAALTNSEFLMNNISKVRKAIDQMISWRFQAGTFVRDRIQKKLFEFANRSIINTTIEVPDLGEVEILPVQSIGMNYQEIDRRFVNRPLTREM